MTKPNKQKTKWEKEIFGFNNRGMVDYISGITPTGYHSASAICKNCGAKAKDTKEADKWQFGHPNCPKPNGEYIKNNITAKRLREIISQLLSTQHQELIKEIIEGLSFYDYKGNTKTVELIEYLKSL